LIPQVIFLSSAQSVYFNQFSAFSASKLFLILEHTKSYWKNTLYRCWTRTTCT